MPSQAGIKSVGWLRPYATIGLAMQFPESQFYPKGLDIYYRRGEGPGRVFLNVDFFPQVKKISSTPSKVQIVLDQDT